jgi:hypothetical protein
LADIQDQLRQTRLKCERQVVILYCLKGHTGTGKTLLRNTFTAQYSTPTNTQENLEVAVFTRWPIINILLDSGHFVPPFIQLYLVPSRWQV